MLNRLIHITGILVIILFSVTSIFFALSSRDLDNSKIGQMMSFTNFFEDRFYDIRMLQTINKDKIDSDLVLAAIDDESLTKIGRWPWSRTTWVKFLNKMKSFDAKIVAFDVFFSEPEMACNAESPDDMLAKSITNFQSVPGNSLILPYSLAQHPHETFDVIPDILFNFIYNSKKTTDSYNLRPHFVSKNVFPIDTLYNTDAKLAHIEAEKDKDGIFRHYPVISYVIDGELINRPEEIEDGGLYFPSFALSIYESFTGDKPTLNIQQSGQTLELGTGNISLNDKGETKIRWFGGQDNYPKVGIFEILEAPDNDLRMKKIFKDNIVFVGSTAFGAHDLRHTPVDAQLPGVYFHMNMTKMLLDGRFFKPLAISTQYSWLILFASTFILLFIQYFNNALLDLFAVTSMTIGLYLLDTYYLVPQGYEIKLFFCIFSAIACYSWTTFLHFYRETKERKKVKGTFSSFVSPAVVEEMLANPDKVKVGGEKKNITVFFSDVRDFTSISEMLTPEQLSLALNKYMGVMTDIIFETNGTLDKYIGDAIVAFWGAPLEVKNHPYHAVKAGLKMVEVLPSINEDFERLNLPLFKHGIGINTGDCSVGNMGSDSIFQYTALGDNMNLGARLEALCKFYGTQLHISEYTINAIPEDLRSEFVFRPLDFIKVKGREEPVRTFEALHSFHPMMDDKESLEKYNQGWQCYQNMEFQEGVNLFSEVLSKHPEDVNSIRLRNVCVEFVENPPPAGWDGVYTHTTKG